MSKWSTRQIATAAIIAALYTVMSLLSSIFGLTYGDAEFSTKQLEKDFGDAAYATIRSFVLKFEKLGLIKSTQYGNRMKYAVRVN